MGNFEIDKDRNLIIERFKGNVSPENIVHLKEIERHEYQGDEMMNILIDIRFAKINFNDGYNIQQMKRLTSVIDESANQRFYLVVGSTDQLFSRFSLQLRDVLKEKLKAFTSYEEAINWIDNNKNKISGK